MQTKLLINAFAGAMAISAVSANAVVFVDEFDGAALDARWALDHDPVNSYNGGQFAFGGNHLRFENVRNDAYAHLETTVDTTLGARADAIIRNDNYYDEDWGIGLTFYYDANNWARVNLGGENAGVADGFIATVMDGGTLTYTALQANDRAYRFDWPAMGLVLQLRISSFLL